MWRANLYWQDGVCDGYGKWPWEAAQQGWDHMRDVLKERFVELGDLQRVTLEHIEGTV